MRKYLYPIDEAILYRVRATVTGFLLALFCAAAFGQCVTAQNTNHPPSANRWLLVVDVSESMQRRAEPVQQVASGLLMSGMNGQMRPGDTVGLWTYDETLHAGDFPLQQWKPDDSRDIAQRAFDFLKGQKYKNNSHFDEVLAGMGQLIKASEFITIILISDGSSEMKGTPFDDKINASYRSWVKEQQKSQMPIVTLLRARRGQITDYAVNTPPWPLEMPPLPAELLQVAKPAPPAPPPAPPPDIVPSLYVSGKKPEPAIAPAATNTVMAAVPEIAAPAEPVEIPATNKSIPVPTKPEPPSPPAVAAPAVPVPDATQVSSGGWLSRKNIWNVGLVLVGVVLGWIMAVIFRPRDNRPISLITRSLDREKE
jgi:hypothetical protein